MFKPLRNIKQVWLERNKCINENFNNMLRISAMRGIVTSKCGYCESHVTAEIQVCEMSSEVSKISGAFQEVIKGQASQIEVLQTFVNKTFVEKESCQSKLLEKAAEIEKLETQIKVQLDESAKHLITIAKLREKLAFAVASNEQVQSIGNLIKGIEKKVDAQSDESCSAYLRNNAGVKLIEAS